VRGDLVLNVAGPWIDRIFRRGAPEQPRLNGGTKGSHLVVEAFPGAPRDVVYYESKTDGRLILVIPWLGRYLIGTTDIRFDEDPDEARCTEDEMSYLLGEINQLIPEAGLTADDVLFTYSGVRPLPYAPGVKESRVPRSHVLHDHAPSIPGLVSVVGGKLTTYRQLAEDAIDDVFDRLGRTGPRCVTTELPLPGAGGDPDKARSFLTRAGLSGRSTERLLTLYGRRGIEVVAEAAGQAELLAVIDEATGAIGAEVLFAVRREFARSLTDVLARRILLAFEPGHGRDSVTRVLALLACELGWDAERQKAEADEYATWLTRLAVPGRGDMDIGWAETGSAAK
jgi:glycerol-3-phosphate dehydrogenase